MIDRLLDAHEVVIEKVREAIKATEENEDWGSNDLLMGDVLRRHELQVWFLSEHVVECPSWTLRTPAPSRAAGRRQQSPRDLER